jgi:hypothetical protein
MHAFAMLLPYTASNESAAYSEADPGVDGVGHLLLETNSTDASTSRKIYDGDGTKHF